MNISWDEILRMVDKSRHNHRNVSINFKFVTMFNRFGINNFDGLDPHFSVYIIVFIYCRNEHEVLRDGHESIHRHEGKPTRGHWFRSDMSLAFVKLWFPRCIDRSLNYICIICLRKAIMASLLESSICINALFSLQ